MVIAKILITAIVILLIMIPRLLKAQEVMDSSFCENKDTVPGNKIRSPRIRFKEVAVPSIMIFYGAASLTTDKVRALDRSTRNELVEDNAFFHNKIDNYSQFSPAVLAFGLKLANVESTHKLSDMFILYALSNTLETGIVHTIKSTAKRERPGCSDRNSFPSGHTATSFVAAEFLHQEYKNKSPWICIGGYTMATLTGISRIYNDAHWVSDVIAGAGIGILSTKIVYWTYPYLQKTFKKRDNKKYQSVFFPGYNEGNVSLNFVCRL